MASALLLTSLVAYADTNALADRVQVHLSAAAQPWVARNGRSLRKVAGSEEVDVVFELEINKKGGFTRVTRSLSSGNPAADRLARGLFRVLPPLPAPPRKLAKAKRNTACAVLLRMRGKSRDVRVVTACLPQGEFPDVTGHDELVLTSPRAELFKGWALESAGEFPRARGALREAVEAAPDWTLASLAMGLHLGRAGRFEEARPFLKRALRNRKPTLEVRRYLKGKDMLPNAGTGGVASGDFDDSDGEAEVSSCQRDESEIFRHIRRRFRPLGRCVGQERKRNPMASIPAALPISFIVAPKGAIRDVTVEHRFYRQGGPLKDCVAKALKARLEPRGGSGCPVMFELEVETISYTAAR